MNGPTLTPALRTPPPGDAGPRDRHPDRGRHHPPAVVVTAAVITVGVVLVGLIGPWVATGDPHASTAGPFATDDGWLGADALGRDVVTRVLHGGRSVVVVAITATFLATTLGSLVGIVAGLAPRRVAAAVTWAADLVVVFPAVLLLLLIAAVLPRSDLTVLVAVSLTTIPVSLRVVGAATRQVVGMGYVELALARGDRWGHVIRHDIVPNIVGTILADAGLRFVTATYLTAIAGFLGLGRSAPAAGWGRMIAENLPGASLNPWAFLAPLLLILLLSVGANLLADHLAGRAAGRSG